MAFKKGIANFQAGKKPWNYLGDIVSKEFLVKEYVINRKTIKQIAVIVDCSYCAIRYRLIQFGIPIRSLSEAFKGLKKSKSHRNKIKRAVRQFHILHPNFGVGKNNANYGKKHPGLGKGRHYSKKSREKMSLAKQGIYEGRNNPHFGKPIKPCWGKYKDINMRSNWEIKYAKYLDNNRIKWFYEPKTFDLGNNTYTPDFYLPKTDEYMEVKGYFPNKVRKKLKLFQRLYPNLNFKILRGKELAKLGIKIEERFSK